MAADFARREAGGCPVLTDPSLDSYRVLGLKRGLLATLGPTSALKGLRAFVNGHRQTRLAGDAWQQGGVIVLDRTGSVVYLQRNADAGDRPDPAAIIVALRRCVTESRTA